MKYFAPIVDFIPKSNFTDRAYIEPVWATQTYSPLRGFKIATLNDEVDFNGIMRSATWELTAAYLSIIADITQDEMRFGIEFWAATDGEIEDRLDTFSDTYSFGPVIDNHVHFIDITDRFTDVLPEDALGFRFFFMGGVYSTNIWVRGVFLDYILI